MSMTDLYVRDRYSGHIHRVGDDHHDCLTVDKNGNVHYQNLQNGDGCRTGLSACGYEFVPNEDEMGYPVNPMEDER